MSSRDREMMFPIELQFLWNDTKWFSRHFTLDGPVENIIRNRGNILWEFTRWDDFISLREGRFIVRPIENGSVEESI